MRKCFFTFGRALSRPRLSIALTGCVAQWVFAWTLTAQVTASPTSKPADKPARQTAEILTAQGVAALSANDAHASDAFLDALQVLRSDKQISQLDPLRVQVQHGLAIAYLQAGRFDKAGEIFKPGDTLDKVVATPAVPRALVYNRAVLDLTQKFNVMRSIKSVKDFLTLHAEDDEQMLNLLGTLIDRASYDERFSKAPLFDQASKFYETASAKLEQSRNGERRWGIEWVPEKEFKKRSRERQVLVDDYNESAAKLSRASAAAQAAAANVDAQSARAKFGRSNSLGSAQNEKARADAKVASCRRDADEKKALIPHYPWLTDAVPIIPDSTTAVAINTPKPAPDASLPAKPATNHRPATADPTPSTNTPPTDTPPVANDVPADVPAPTAARARITHYAAAFPIAPDLLLTARSAVSNASRISLEDAQGSTFTATLERSDEKTGLALIRVAGAKFSFVNLASQFAGGEVKCTGFPSVAIFSPSPETLVGKSAALKADDTGNWLLSFTTNPRLPGAPLTAADGLLVGVAMAERDSVPQQVPAVRLSDVKAFLGSDAPNVEGAHLDQPYVLQLTATTSK